MHYLYHWVPKNMTGDILFPLNTLKQTHPDIYEKEAIKYAGREEIMQFKIPVLDCLWNDVLHFSAVHPSKIKQALMEAGIKAPLDVVFFEIDPKLLKSDNTIVYLYRHNKAEDQFKTENFAKYNPDNIEEYSVLPQETKDYYKEMISQKRRPFQYHRVPHILYKGFVDVSKAKKITW